MKTWLFSCLILFGLAIVFHQRGFQSRNAAFSAYLVACLAAQPIYLIVYRLQRAPEMEGYLDTLLWVLAGAALVVSFLHRTDSINQVILAGLAAMVALHLSTILFAPAHSGNLGRWASNVCGLVPTIYMLVMFSGIRLDALPLFVRTKLLWGTA